MIRRICITAIRVRLSFGRSWRFSTTRSRRSWRRPASRTSRRTGPGSSGLPRSVRKNRTAGESTTWVMDRCPIEGPDGSYRKSGAIVLDAIDYKPVEMDPLRWHDKSDATGIVRANVAGGYPGVRRFCTPSSRFRIVGFRVVLGPDLEKEWQTAAKRKTKKK